MSELKERKDIDVNDQWDLSTLFVDDNAFEKALMEVDPLIQTIRDFSGKLNNAETIHAYLKLSTDIKVAMDNIFSYASLRKSEDTRDTKAQSMYSRAYGKYVSLMAANAFAEPEILSLSKEELDALVKNPIVKDYQFYLEDMIRAKVHTLSAAEEEVLAKFQEVLNNPEEVANMLMDADMVFDSVEDSEGTKHELSVSNYILLQTSSDRILRKNAFLSFYKSYQQHINTLASTYSGCVNRAVIEAKIRNYSSSREMALDANNIPTMVYDNLIAVVHKRMDLMYRYVRLRKRMLGLSDLHYYDLYTPLCQNSIKHYSYDEAKNMVLDAVKPLGEEYVGRVKKAYEDHWIDVYPNKGKSGGAFSSGTYTSNPFILTNFTGTLDSVSTLAHEMGHSQHTWLTNHTQPAQYADYSLFVAEVASTVNENLLIEQMLKNETDPANRMSLLNQYLEGFKGTVYRQTMFAEFEKEAHALKENGESLTADALNAIYKRLVKEYFGEELVWDDAVKYEWARIPHFYALFYVYVYATGYSSACAISEGILSGKQDAVKNYLEFLSMGSSAYPLEELKHAGVDLTTSKPIDIALDKFEKVLEDAEKTAAKLGL